MKKKLCKITTTRSRTRQDWVTVEACAGAKGTGASIHKCSGFDNGRAIDASFDAVLFEVRRQGYEPVEYDASGDE